MDSRKEIAGSLMSRDASGTVEEGNCLLLIRKQQPMWEAAKPSMVLPLLRPDHSFHVPESLCKKEGAKQMSSHSRTSDLNGSDEHDIPSKYFQVSGWYSRSWRIIELDDSESSTCSSRVSSSRFFL